MTIQWFPGHMTRARRQIEEKLKIIDVVIELLDARIPESSRNPMIDQILRGKPRVILLNKSDLADPAATTMWVENFEERGIDAIPFDAASGNGLKQIEGYCRDLYLEKQSSRLKKGMKPGAVRVLIVGIPNVGKSTLINRLAGRKITAIGNRPGITKGQQWIKIGDRMQVLDTPGILWPKFEDEQVAVRLAATGAIRDEVLNVEDIAFHMIQFLLQHYKAELSEQYGLTELPEELDEPSQIVQVMEDIGRKKGCLQKGNIVNLEKTSTLFLQDLRAGKIGRLTFDRPLG